MAVWQRALSATEAVQAYHGGKICNFTAVVPDNIAAWYRFEPYLGDSAVAAIRDQIGIYGGITGLSPGYGGVNPSHYQIALEANAGEAGTTWPSTTNTTIPSPIDWPQYGITGSTYDNLFVQHQIPQSDRNYQWITSSLKSGSAFFGYDKLVNAPGLHIVDEYTNKSIIFDGSSNRVPVGNAEQWNSLIGGATASAKAFSFSAWIRPKTIPSMASAATLFEFGSRSPAPETARSCLLYPSGATSASNPGIFAVPLLKLSTGMLGYSTFGPDFDEAPPAYIPTLEWTHVTLTYAGGQQGDINIYINGSSTTMVESGHSPAPILSPEGTAPSSLGRKFDGQICDAAVWSKELGAAEVTEIYGGGFRTKLSSTSAKANLVSWWMLGADPRDLTAAGTVEDPSYFVSDYMGYSKQLYHQPHLFARSISDSSSRLSSSLWCY